MTNYLRENKESDGQVKRWKLLAEPHFILLYLLNPKLCMYTHTHKPTHTLSHMQNLLMYSVTGELNIALSVKDVCVVVVVLGVGGGHFINLQFELYYFELNQFEPYLLLLSAFSTSVFFFPKLQSICICCVKKIQESVLKLCFGFIIT